MIQIGVSGHRFLADVESLKAGVNQVLARIEQDHPGQEWAVISALAEGADRLVVSWIWEFKPGSKLIVPLPLALEEYLKDFEGNESKQEFMAWLGLAVEVIPLPEPAPRVEGYRAAGIYVLEHCDVLIALWDGLEPQGRGGTGEIVALGRERGIPLAWVHSQRLTPKGIQSENPDQDAGTVSYEGFES